MLTPRLTITEEWNDNVFLEDRHRTGELITALTPGVELTLEDSIHRVSAAYGFSALLYASESQFNSAKPGVRQGSRARTE